MSSHASYTLLIVDRAAREQAKASEAQALGQCAERGFSPEQLRALHAKLSAEGSAVSSRLYELTSACRAAGASDANVLVVKLPADVADGAYAEMRDSVKYSRYAFRYGRRVTSRSRNIAYVSGEPCGEDPESNAPEVVAWRDVPHCQRVREFLNDLLCDTEAVHAVAIRYADIRECGIRWHGDAERRKTLVTRLGPNSKRHPFWLMWYHNHAPVSDPIRIDIEHGEVCIPSEKAVGTDCKRYIIPTLRHATGFLKTDGAVPKVSAKAQKRMRSE